MIKKYPRQRCQSSRARWSCSSSIAHWLADRQGDLRFNFEPATCAYIWLYMAIYAYICLYMPTYSYIYMPIYDYIYDYICVYMLIYCVLGAWICILDVWTCISGVWTCFWDVWTCFWVSRLVFWVAGACKKGYIRLGLASPWWLLSAAQAYSLQMIKISRVNVWVQAANCEFIEIYTQNPLRIHWIIWLHA